MKMKSAVGTAAMVIVVGAGAGLYAQSSDASRNQRTEVTVTGCLQSAGSDRAVGTAGSASTDPAAAERSKGPFTLVNARVGNAPGGGSAVTSVAPPGSGTNESAVRAGDTSPSQALAGAIDKNGEPTRPGAMYAVRGGTPEIPRHVGQEVEISGYLISPGGSAGAGRSSTSTSAPHAATASGTAADGSMPEIEVKTLRMIASACASR